MKAIVVGEFGAPEVMKLEEVPAPKAGPGQVLVRVHAAGVNPADTYVRTGNYAIKPNLPYTPGTDGAGVVEALGDGATGFRPGDRVYIGRSITGTYAEYAMVLPNQIHRLPGNISFPQGAGVYVPYGTAFHALHHHARARAGETVLVHGASGGVGIAAVQMARAMGLTVFGTAGTPKGIELALREGAHQAFDHSKPDYREALMKATGGKGVNVILEMLANVNLGHDLKLIAMNGRIVVIGSRGDVIITPRDLMGKRGSVHAFTLWAISESEASELHDGLEAGLENGTLRPIVGKELPLQDAAQAHHDVMASGAFGKVVLIA